MENLRKRVDVKLVRSHEEEKLRRLIASPAFARVNIFDDDLAAIQVHKSRLVLNRPVFVGMSILDLSKHQMYDLLQPALGAVRGSLPAPLHRHRQPPPRGPDRGCLQGHGQTCRPLRHFGLPERPPAAQHGEQEGAGQESQGCEEERGEETHPPRAVQRGMNVLRSVRHHIYGQHLNKISLSSFDSKSWIAENGVDTLAYGHKDAIPTEMDGYIEELFSA